MTEDFPAASFSGERSVVHGQANTISDDAGAAYGSGDVGGGDGESEGMGQEK